MATRLSICIAAISLCVVMISAHPPRNKRMVEDLPPMSTPSGKKMGKRSPLADFYAKLAAAGDKLVVVELFATWCGPCRIMDAYIAGLAADPDYSNVVFLKVDIDEDDDVAQELDVTTIPAFNFFKNNTEIAEMVGQNRNNLKYIIDQHK